MSSRWIALGGTLIELLAAFVVVYHATLALSCIVRRQGSDKARLVIAEGVLSALGFMAAGTLLTTLALQTWVQIRTFAVILTMRTLLKKVFSSEKTSIEAHR
jgi:uncharacterized membrane protein